MGHYIEMTEFKKGTSERKMYATAVEIAGRNCDRYENPSGTYHSSWKNFNMHFSSYERAYNWLMDRRSYEDGYVTFDYRKDVEDTAKIKKLVERLDNAIDAKLAFKEKNDIHNRVSKFIGCKGCKSNLNIIFIKGHDCSLCGYDLRSKTVIEGYERHREKCRELNEKIKYERKKLKSKQKPEVRILMKTEVHC